MSCETVDSTMSKEERKSHDKKLRPARNSSSANQGVANSQASTLNILSLNDDVFQEILSYFSFDEVAKLRSVCRRFNDVCQKTLNTGFLAVQRYHSRCLKDMKAKLPRRESERRTHPLARHIDILTGIETRLSLLSMTYYKYTVLGVFCFIPGKVLDECYRVLREVVVHKNPPKSYELLQELRDISSMAMEHFEEHIVPTMKKSPMMHTTFRNNLPRFMRCPNDAEEPENDSIAMPSTSALTVPNLAPKLGPISTFTGLVRSANASFSGAANASAMGSPNTSSNLSLELVVNHNRALINAQRKVIADLKAKLLEHGRKMTEQDRLLNEYGRKLIELEQKLNGKLTEGRAQPPLALSADTPPPSAKKRPARAPVDQNDEDQPIVKRKLTAEKKDKQSASSFAMSLRKRKNLD